jgi:hypothetical protein
VRSAFLAFLFLLPAQDRPKSGPPSEEALALDLLEQGRFPELEVRVRAMPEDSALRALLEAPTGRLRAIHARLIETLDAGGRDIELKEVHPDALRGGKVVGATPTALKVNADGRTRQVLLAGLPGRVLLELARRVIKEVETVSELEAALGLGGPGTAEARAARDHVRGQRLAEARSAIGTAPPGGLWAEVGRRWIARLEAAVAARDLRIAGAVAKLPRGAKMLFWQDFEEGPELLPRAWDRGIITTPPDGEAGGNAWSRKSVFVQRDLPWGEMLDEYEGIGNRPDRAPAFVMEERVFLAARIWSDNVRQMDIGMDTSPTASGERYSHIDLTLEKLGGWNEVKVRLDEFTKHRPYSSKIPLVRMGDQIWRLAFHARRADRNRPEGHFYIDDLRIYSLPRDDVEEK